MFSRFLPVSLTWRLTLYYVVAFFLFLGASYLVLYWSIGSVLDSKMDEDLSEDVAAFAELLGSSGVDDVIREMEKEVLGGGDETVFLFLYRSDGRLVHSTNLQHWRKLHPSELFIREQFNHASEHRLVTLDFASQESETRGVYGSLSPEYMMFLGESFEERDDIMELLAMAFALMFLLMVPVALLMVWLITRQSIAGIQSVSRAALDIKAGNLDRRVNVAGQAEEVQTLADTFDAMADRIQQLIRNMREMTDNIAHDLRSPISRVRLLCESSLRTSATDAQFSAVAEGCITECDRLIKMINISLDVAETEAGVAMHSRCEIDMNALIEDACELFETVAEEKGLIMSSQLQAECTVFGDINSIQRMVANVLDNAIKYTPSGGIVHIETQAKNNAIELAVTDSGVGVESQDYENIFNRFYRVDPSRTSDGCGLGLSYARAVARAHGGDVQVRSLKGETTTFAINLPCMHNR